MHLVGIGKQVVMEKDGVKLRISEKAFDEGFILPCTGDVIPAIGGAVGNNGVKSGSFAGGTTLSFKGTSGGMAAPCRISSV